MQITTLESCTLCGHHCKVNRLKGQLGRCRAGEKVEVASYCIHHGEEPMISGRRGSGTIFFSHCCLRCVYCQNYEISQGRVSGDRDISGQGIRISEYQELIEAILDLQGQGAHNINLVSPTHYGVQILEAVKLARKKGLKLPLVYNTGGYDSLELLEMLDGEIEIYMPDLKYFDNEKAFKYSGVRHYVETATVAVAEMFRQVGNIKFNREGVAISGLLVRHLVLPNNLADSRKVLDFIASLSKNIWVSIMAQYSPQFRAGDYPELARRLRREEYQAVVDYARKIGLRHLYVQDLESSETYLPDFKKKEEPFIFSSEA